MRKTLALAPLSLGLLLSPLAAQSVLQHLPAETLLAVSLPDLDTSIREFGQMPLAKIWHEEEVQNFVRDAIELVKEQIEKGMAEAKEAHKAGKMPVDPAKLLALRLRGGTFAVTHMSLAAGDAGPVPKFGLLVHLDFGDTAEQWNDLLRMGIDMMTQAAANEMDRQDSDVGSVKVITFKKKDAPPGMEMSLNVAMVGNGLLIGSLTEDVTATVKALTDHKQVLGATDRYKANSKHLMVDGAEAEMFMRLDGMIGFGVEALGLLAQMQPRQMEWFDAEGLVRAVDALGLNSCQSIGATSSYQNGKAVTNSYVVSPAPSRKGLLAGTNKLLDLGFLSWVPKDAVSFSGSTMDPMSIYDSLVAALNAYDPAVAEKLLGHLTKMEEKVGFNLRDDLFGALGDTLIVWSMPMATMMSPPETAFLLKVNDQEKIVKVLRSLTAMSDGYVELEENERRGVKTYQFRVNFDPMNGMGMNPFDIINPSFAFKDGWLVAGFSPSDIRRVFQQMERKGDDPKTDIRGNKEFAAYQGQIPAQVQSLSFTDWKANFESYYQIATSLVAFVPVDENIPFDMSMLPDASTLTKHMFGSIQYATVDANGISGTSISPFGPEVILLLCGVIGAGAGAAMALMPRGF